MKMTRHAAVFHMPIQWENNQKTYIEMLQTSILCSCVSELSTVRQGGNMIISKLVQDVLQIAEGVPVPLC
jgi:hypothetical protein